MKLCTTCIHSQRCSIEVTLGWLLSQNRRNPLNLLLSILVLLKAWLNLLNLVLKVELYLLLNLLLYLLLDLSLHLLLHLCLHLCLNLGCDCILKLTSELLLVFSSHVFRILDLLEHLVFNLLFCHYSKFLMEHLQPDQAVLVMVGHAFVPLLFLC